MAEPPDKGILRLPEVEGLSPAEASLLYGQYGWHIFPCEAVNFDPSKKSWAKKPHSMLRREEAARGAGGWKLATTDLDKIAAWWEEDPLALIGLVPGMSGCVVCDADGAAGIKALYDVAKDLDLSTTATSRTPGKGGGLHVWFDRRAVNGVIGNGSLIGVPGEARGDRGYVIVPPSRLPDGGEYRFTGHTHDLAPLPQWASSLLPWERAGSMRASIADVTRGDEQEWLQAKSAPWNDQAAKDAVAAAVREITGAVPGDQLQGRHPTATRHAASILTKAQRREIAIDLPEALGAIRDALVSVKPEGGADFDRFVSDAIATRVAEDKARASSVIDPSTLRVAEEEQLTWSEPEQLRKVGHRGMTRPFPLDEMPDVMRRFVEEVAKGTQMSEVFPAMAALGAASAATAGGIVVSMTPTWTEGLSLYLIGVADPSERKTAAMKPFVDSIRRAASEWTASVAGERHKWVSEKAVLERELKELVKGGDAQEIAKAEAALELHEQDGARFIIPNGIIHADTTQEALIVEMARQHGVGFLASSEGAFIANLAGRYTQGERTDLTIVNEAYSRSFIRSTRVTRGDAVVPVPHLTIVSFVQPRVAELLARPDFEASGFNSRVLYAHPPTLVGSRATTVSSFQPFYVVARDAWGRRMQEIFARGWGREEDPIVMRLDAEAVAVLETWWADAERAAVTDPWWGKAHGNAVRLAALLELVENPSATHVTAPHLRSSLSLMDYFGGERGRMRREVLEGDGYSVEMASQMRRMLGHIARRWDRAEEGIRLRDLAKWMHGKHGETFNVAEQLVETGWLREGDKDGTYIPHPSIPKAAETDFEGPLRVLAAGENRLQEFANERSLPRSAPVVPRSTAPVENASKAQVRAISAETAPVAPGGYHAGISGAGGPGAPGISKAPFEQQDISSDLFPDSERLSDATPESNSFTQDPPGATGANPEKGPLTRGFDRGTRPGQDRGTPGQTYVREAGNRVENEQAFAPENGATGALSQVLPGDSLAPLMDPVEKVLADSGSDLASRMDAAVDEVLAEPDVQQSIRSMIERLPQMKMPEGEEAGHTNGPTLVRDLPMGDRTGERCPGCNSLWMVHGVTGERYCPKGCDQ